MASQALYLKWRPQRFEDVVGQDHVTQTLRNALLAGRIAHAYLFSGPRGTGKTTMARLLAKAVNCLDEDPANRPCNVCSICRAVNEGRLLDLIEIDAASHTGVDNVREAIRDRVGFRPTEARYKVYVIDEVHMLSTSAFNALLKTLEEPPEHVIFCLATTEPHKVLPTILSRCQQFEFHRIPLPALVARLQVIADKEGIAVERDALEQIARVSTGCARDAIGLLDQLTAYGEQTITVERLHAVLGLGSTQGVHDLVSHLAAHRLGPGLDTIHQTVESGADIRQFTQQIVETLRALLLLRVGGQAALTNLDAQTRNSLTRLAEEVRVRDLIRWIKLFNQAQLDLRGSDQNRVALELAFVEAALAEEAPPATEPQAAVSATARAPAVISIAERAASPSPAASSFVKPTGLPAVPSSRPPRAEHVRPQEGLEPPVGAEEVVREGEVRDHWSQIRSALRRRSRQVEALVNSGSLVGVQDGNRIVFEFPSEFLSSKLEKEENRRIVEEAIAEVLGRPCRVQGVLRGTVTHAPAVAERAPANRKAAAVAPPVAAPEGAGEQDAPDAERSEGAVEASTDPYRAAHADPVVQDLIRRGGQVTDVQPLSGE